MGGVWLKVQFWPKLVIWWSLFWQGTKQRRCDGVSELFLALSSSGIDGRVTCQHLPLVNTVPVDWWYVELYSTCLLQQASQRHSCQPDCNFYCYSSGHGVLPIISWHSVFSLLLHRTLSCLASSVVSYGSSLFWDPTPHGHLHLQPEPWRTFWQGLLCKSNLTPSVFLT